MIRHHIDLSQNILARLISLIGDLEANVNHIENTGSTRSLAFALNELANAHSEVGHIETALDRRLKALELMRHHGSDVQRSMIQYNLARDYYYLGELEAAFQEIQIAQHGLSKRHPSYEGAGHKVLGDIYLGQGNIAEARNAYREGAKSVMTDRCAGATVALGWLDVFMGETSIAACMFNLARNLLHNDEITLSIGATAGLAISHLLMGAHQEASHEITQAIEKCQTHDNLRVTGFVFAAEAVFLSAAGRHREAEEKSTASDEVFSRTEKPMIGLCEKLEALMP